MHRMKWGAGVFGAVVAAGLIAYAIFGMGGKASAADPSPRDQYEQLLAAQLGVTVEKLHSATTNARNQMIDQLQQQGKITADQANKMKNAPAGGGFPGLGFLGRAGSGGPERGGVHTDLASVTASTLHITVDAFRQELQSGKTPAQVAAAYNVARDVLKTALVDAENADLQKAVAAAKVTQTQANQITSNIPSQVDRFLDAARGKDGPGFGGPRGNRPNPGAPNNQQGPNQR